MRKLKAALSLALLIGATFLFHTQFLTAAASYLVQTQPESTADLIVVLGGDVSGARAMTGCRLLERGLANELWISGLASIYGKSEGELAVEFLTKNGCPADKMKGLKNNVDSTRDEAYAISAMMRTKGIRRYLLVTSNFHTRRAGKVFREAAPDLEAIVVPSEDNEFQLDSWWRTRHSQKIFLYEWMKTVGYWVGL